MLQGRPSVIRASPCMEHLVSVNPCNDKIGTSLITQYSQKEWRRPHPWAPAPAGHWRTSSSRPGLGWVTRTTRQLIIWTWILSCEHRRHFHSKPRWGRLKSCICGCHNQFRLLNGSKKSTCEEIYLDMSRLNKINIASDYLEMERLQQFQPPSTNW